MLRKHEMDIHHCKKELLQILYDLYDEISQEFNTACRVDCSTCCSHNVISTTIEAWVFRDHIVKTGRLDLFEKLRNKYSGPYMRPTVTINKLAEHCFRRENPPADPQDYEYSPCPIREESGCPLYSVRPFACRAMWSQDICDPGGHATIDPFVLTVNSVFEQLIEQIDVGGLCGNLIDLIVHMDNSDVLERYTAGQPLRAAAPFISTVVSPGFLVPPEHRERVRPVLERIWSSEVDEHRFRDIIHILRTQH